jgi:hypothetical protein
MKLYLLIYCITNILGIHAAGWPAAKDLQKMPIIRQADWDTVAAVAARQGDANLLAKAFGGFDPQNKPRFGPGNSVTEVVPNALPIPYLHPFCAQLVELALQNGHLAIAGRIYDQWTCKNTAVGKTPMAVADVLRVAAEQLKFAHVPLLLSDILLRTAAEPEQRAALRQVADGVLKRALEYKKTDLVDLLVGDPLYQSYSVADLQLSRSELTVLDRLRIMNSSRNFLATEKYFINADGGGGGDGGEDAPMLVCLIRGDMGALRQLLAHDGIHPTPSMLLMAAHHGHLDMVKYMYTGYPDAIAEMSEGGWGVLLLEAAEHDHVETVAWILERNPWIRAGVREALHTALEHTNSPIQRMLMGVADFSDHRKDSADWLDMDFLVRQAILAANAGGLDLLLATDYVRSLSGLAVPDRLPYDEAHKDVIRLLLLSPAVSTVSIAEYLVSQSLQALQALLNLVPLDRQLGVVARTAERAIHIQWRDCLAWLLGQFGNRLDARSARRLLATAYVMRNVKAMRLVLTYVPVDSAVRSEFCQKVTLERHEKMMKLLCGAAIN